MLDKIQYKPSAISKANEENIKRPLIIEHNIMGVKFKNKEISSNEWVAFKTDWLKRLSSSMHDIVKDRIYVEDISLEGVK